ncbi:MAG TPA: hypothetical protein VJU16_05375 [Planctomycetota bacterium]|nr:hypothetical protein [Planctomycetota bacterium]
MDQERRRPSAARWLQPNPVPFWATRLFRWNLVLCSLILCVVAGWFLVVEPKMTAKEREADRKAFGAEKYTPRDPSTAAPKEVRFDGMLDKVGDDVTPEVRDDPYRYLVKYMATVDPARLAGLAKEADYKDLMTRTDDLRGLTVRLRLQFWKAPDGPVRLDPPAGGVETVTRAYLALPEAPKEVYFVDFVEPPPDIEKETPVVLDAVFLRRVKYERSDRTGEFHQAPLLVARNIAKVQPPKKPAQYRFLPVAVLLGVAMFAFLAFLTIKMFMAARSSGPVPRRIPD